VVYKQRHSVFDGFLLHVVLPYLHDSKLRPLMHLAAMWHRPVA
jgi:hypothetical protein